MKHIMIIVLFGIFGLNVRAEVVTMESIPSWKKIVGKESVEDSLIKNVRETVLSYEFREGVPVVKIVINGHSYYFLFDTCAGLSSVSDKVVNTEKLDCQQTGQTIMGIGESLVIAEISELMLGNLMLRDRKALVMSAQNPIYTHLGIDGIIGANVVSEFVVTIDSKNQTIMLSDRVDDSIVQWDSLKFWKNLPLLSIRVKGADEVYDVPALFDTGNGMSAIGLPSVQGFEQWRQAGIIEDVEEGNGFIGTMVNGMVKTEKLYRGQMTGLYLGNVIFPKVPIITGGIGYLLLCFKVTDLGKFVLDYPRRRYHFEAYMDAMVWKGDRRPVMTGINNGELKIAAVWGKEVCRKLAPEWTVTAMDSISLSSFDLMVPDIDELVQKYNVKMVTVRDLEGKEHQLSAEMFLEGELR